MRWSVVRLEDLAAKDAAGIKIGPFGSQLKKTELVSAGIHVVGIENVLKNKFDGLGERYVSEEKFQTLRSVEIRAGDVLITMMGTIGEVAVVPEGTSPSIMDSHLLRFRPNRDICTSEYIRWLIKGGAATKTALHGRAHGAIMKGLNSGIIRSLPAPVPPLSEQRRIVEILDQADALRKKRLEADVKAVRILPALFCKMFGDPTTNPKGWKTRLLGDLGDLDRGISKHRPRNDPSLLGGQYPFIQTGDVANAQGYIRTYSSTYSEIGVAQSKMWPAGTLCITIAANIGASAILGFDACFPDSVVGFTPGPDTNSGYIRVYLDFIRPLLEGSASQVAQKNINLKVLRELSVPVPPNDLQTDFFAEHDRVLSLGERQQEARLRLDQVWKTLLYRGFSGDLTAKWRDEHMKELLTEMNQQAKYLNL
jgi:type I restriction enzyme, S subunit